MLDACPLIDQLAAAWPPAHWRELPVVLAVSGGADSVALLRGMTALAEGSGRLVVAHFDHALRPESHEDADFVAALADSLGMPCHVGRPALPLRESAGGEGLESAARSARYDFLRETAEHCGARYVVTAHTADDQAETILHRIVRGAGLSGIAGMRRARRLGPATTLIRPLLSVRRQEVLAYLESLGQPYREDASNLSQHFTRNRIRHDLLPKLRAEFNPDVDAALLRLGRLAAEAQQIIHREVERLLEFSTTPDDDGGVQIQCAPLATVEPYLLRELLLALWRRENWPQQAMTFARWQELAAMILPTAALPKPQTLPGAIYAERRDDVLLLRPLVRESS